MDDTHRIKHIDAWRFIAVNMVFVAHIIVSINQQFSRDIIPAYLRTGAFGHLGVLIFFFISGFVICGGLMVEQKGSMKICLRAFYIRRVFRIVPPFYLYLLAVSFVIYFGLVETGYRQIIKSALFLCNMDKGGGGCGWVAGHTWSLAYEEQFYLVFPLLFVALGLMNRPRFLLTLLFFMVVASVGFLAHGGNWYAAYLRYMIFLLTGCAAALFWRHIFGWVEKVSIMAWSMVIVVLLIMVMLLPVSIEDYIMTLVYPALIGLLVLGTPVSHPGVRKFFHSSSVTYCGKISYTVYLWQQLATFPFPGLSPWWTFLFSLGVWPFAHFSYKFFEKPLILFASKLSDQIKQRTSVGWSEKLWENR